MWLHYILILYILLIGTIFRESNQGKAMKILCLILTFGLFTVLASFRSDSVGNDTAEYLRIFNDISSTGGMSLYSWRYEKGYLFLNKILSLITDQSQIILIITSVMIMFGFARFIFKYSNNIGLSVYLFFTLGYYGMSINTIRLSLAIVIILFSYDFLREKKLIKFIISVLLASLFHRAALIFLIAWFIVKLKFSYKIIGIAMAGSIGLCVAFPAILQIVLRIFPTYQYYLGSSYLDGNIRLASVMNFLVGLSIMAFGAFTNYHKKATKLNGGNVNCVNDGENMLLFLLVGISITLISFNFSLLDRVSKFFFAFSIVYLPNAVKSISDKKERVILSYIIIVLFFVYSTTIQIMRPEWNVIYPYSFFWSNEALN